ncbi:hypothetical protein BDW22DRAFT_1399720 [Trametopsis cervina]|nr:hypothetical protein BDW22DRAFT_1399720 [Trametopsis cervina]
MPHNTEHDRFYPLAPTRARPGSTDDRSFFTGSMHDSAIPPTRTGPAYTTAAPTMEPMPEYNETMHDPLEATRALVAPIMMFAALFAITLFSSREPGKRKRVVRALAVGAQPTYLVTRAEMKEPYVIPSQFALPSGHQGNSSPSLSLAGSLDLEDFFSCHDSPSSQSVEFMPVDSRDTLSIEPSLSQESNGSDPEVDSGHQDNGPGHNAQDRPTEAKNDDSVINTSQTSSSSLSRGILEYACPCWPPQPPSPSELPVARRRSSTHSGSMAATPTSDFQSNAGFAEARPGQLTRRSSLYADVPDSDSADWRQRRPRPRVATEGWNMISEHIARCAAVNGTAATTSRSSWTERSQARRRHAITVSQGFESADMEEDVIVWDLQG